MRERFGASNTRSMMCRFHVQTAGSSLTAQSIDNNVVRTTRPGARGGPRRRPEPPHELPRRGARPADRGGGPARAPDPADPRPRVRRHRDARPARRLVLRRDRSPTSSRPRRRPTSTRSTRWAARSRRSRAASSSARSRSRRTGSSARSSAATGSSSASTGSATRTAGAPPADPAHRPGGRSARQVEGVRRVRAERDPAAWAARDAPPRATRPRGDGQPPAADHRGGRRATRRSARSATGCAARGACTAS